MAAAPAPAAAAAARVVPAALHVLRLPAPGSPEHGNWGDFWLLSDPGGEVALGDLLHCLGRSGRLSALSVSLCKSVFYGAFVWARRALNSQNRRFPARAVEDELTGAGECSRGR